MSKYRLLTLTELKELEKEFIEYLVLNSITADEWESLKKDKNPKADAIIEFFSDVVFESILRKIIFLEYKSKNAIQVFQCLAEKLVVVSMEVEPAEDIDFTDSSYIQKAMASPPESLKVFTTSKPYKNNRESELFEMLQTGCVITNDKLFKTLCLML